jgi:hypothetical protein
MYGPPIGKSCTVVPAGHSSIGILEQILSKHSCLSVIDVEWCAVFAQRHRLQYDVSLVSVSPHVSLCRKLPHSQQNILSSSSSNLSKSKGSLQTIHTPSTSPAPLLHNSGRSPSVVTRIRIGRSSRTINRVPIYTWCVSVFVCECQCV